MIELNMLYDRIYADYIQARKQRDQKKTEFIGFLRSELVNSAKQAKKDKLDDCQVIKILRKQEKKLKEALASCQDSLHQAACQSIKFELSLINSYLPACLSPEEINRIIEKIIQEVGANSITDIKKVMPEALKKIGSQASPQDISAAIKAKLTS